MSPLTFLVIAFLLQSDVEKVEKTVEQMRGRSMQLQGVATGNGTWSEEELAKRGILKALAESGKKSIPPLGRALKDSDVQVRRNAALTMIHLAVGRFVEPVPPLDITEAIPDLIKAMEDEDASVRAWAAGAVGETGSNGKQAVPALLRLLKDPAEGPRNRSCLALGRIGPAAKEALPGLYEALEDPSRDVRRFAQQAIDKIQKQ